jgi:putative toxin-antitoxin system antitoxin component (TIGR02293 family)
LGNWHKAMDMDGLRQTHPFDRLTAVRSGLPVAAADLLISSGALTAAELDALVLPRKTLANRRKIGTLNPEQSDRLTRVVRIIGIAEETFGNAEKAHKWLRRPATALENHAPLRLLDTDEGTRMVETLLGRISHGIAA